MISLFKKIALTTLGCSTILVGGVYLLTNKSSNAPTEQNNLISVQYFENFDKGAQVEIIYKTKNSTEITAELIAINNKAETIPAQSKNASDIVYHINENDKYIDIQLSQNKVIISGLQQGHKALLSLNETPITQATPVDWAGRLTLHHAIKNLNQRDFCLTLITETEKKICHGTKQQVAS